MSLGNTVLQLLFIVLISLVSVSNLLYFYISTFRSMCAVPNMAVFCSSLTSCFPGMLLMYYLNEIVPVVPIITGVTFIIIIIIIIIIFFIIIVNTLGNAGWLNLIFLGGDRGAKDDILCALPLYLTTGTGFATQWQVMCSPSSPYFSPYSQLATSSMTGTRFPAERENLLFATDFTSAGPTRRPMTTEA